MGGVLVDFAFAVAIVQLEVALYPIAEMLFRQAWSLPFFMSLTIKELSEYPPVSTCSWGQLSTEYGVVWMAFCGEDLCFLGFARDMDEDLWPRVARRIPRPERVLSQAQMRRHWLAVKAAWLHGEVLPFALAFCSSCFEIAVWQVLQRIPLGKTVSYSWVAEEVGKPKAVRAVASAVGRNRFSVLIPCHRVVAKSGSLGGYAWGPSCKWALLSAEGVALS